MTYRKPIRLTNYDYSKAGYYYITICTENMKKLLWKETEFNVNSSSKISAAGITTYSPPLSESGMFIETALKNIHTIYDSIFVDEYVIMPNHIHFILVIEDKCNGRRPMAAPTVSRIVQQFKGYVTKNCRQFGLCLQKSYYEHIVRNEQDLKSIREYIVNNPIKWLDDDYYQ